MRGSTSPRLREVARKKAKEAMREMRENRRYIKQMRAKNVPDREIAIALGIPEDSPLFEQL